MGSLEEYINPTESKTESKGGGHGPPGANFKKRRILRSGKFFWNVILKY